MHLWGAANISPGADCLPAPLTHPRAGLAHTWHQGLCCEQGSHGLCPHLRPPSSHGRTVFDYKDGSIRFLKIYAKVGFFP